MRYHADPHLEDHEKKGVRIVWPHFSKRTCERTSGSRTSRLTISPLWAGLTRKPSRPSGYAMFYPDVSSQGNYTQPTPGHPYALSALQ